MVINTPYYSNMRNQLIRIVLTMTIFTALSDGLNGQHLVLPLWEDGVPNSKETTTEEHHEVTDKLRISHVLNPTIEVYLPSQGYATGQAVVICPGGGYRILAYHWEGTDVAKMLNAHGIAGIVLKYRLPDDDSNIEPHKSPLMDAEQAMKVVRSNAEDWNIDPKKVGVMGFSAGGHLAATLGTHFSQESRPDFMALIYPVVSMQEEITHKGSRNYLLGKNPSKELVNFYSNELQVKENTPPSFIVHSSDDASVPVANSIRLYEQLIAAGISTEMHIYSYGGHGFGLAVRKGYLSSWTDRFIEWLNGIQ